MRSIRILLTGAVIAVAVAACSSTTSSSTTAAGSGPSITIGSTNFSEQVIVANLYADVLKHAGAKVTLRANLGTREAVEPALAAGQLDLYPDYAGTLLIFLKSSDAGVATQTSTAVPALKTILGTHGATVLDPAPAIDSNVFAVTRATAARYHLTTLSSLSSVASQLVLGGPPECPQRPLCQIGLENTYGLHFKSFTSLDEAGPITVSALKSGEVQVAELFSSDGSIVQNNFVQLTDDKHLQPADYLIPVIRKSVATPTVAAALDGLSAKLTTAELSQLNIKVNVDHDDPSTVAQQWLQQKHLV
ncbi:MAG TPA: ABC transporter substrate-binding protein [Acidimicrobiales bacterium]|nr:ABC transporter substrate-binding protein [Acidimicrobiales bacterium]